jgi:NodT family efflux transporter outer membrane factor (OMF) lipoprotein
MEDIERMIGRRYWGLVSLGALAGCATSAPYHPPQVPLPPGFTIGQVGAVPHEADWWQVFNDPTLTSLVNRALTANLDVQQAATRIREARAQERITRSASGPQINASGQASYNRLSGNSLPPGLAGLFSGSPDPSSGSGLGLPGETFSIYQLGFDASWEVDLFGGQRRANQAAGARADAALWSARDAEVVLAAEVANTYQQYRALQRRLSLLEQTLATQRESAEFLSVRARHGLVPESDAHAQQRVLLQTLAQQQDLAAQAQARAHALAMLLGLPPADLSAELAAAPSDPPVAVDVPPGLPSQLVERRPDLRAAERQLAAATADVGVATADLYPKFSLTGALQLASRSLSTLLESDSLQDNVNGRISLPLLDRARAHATVQLRQAQADEALLAYRGAILIALRDVEDALMHLQADRERLGQLRGVACSAQEDADSAAVRYRHGLVAATELLAAQQTSQQASDAQVQAEAVAAQDVVALYKALGGGWNPQRTSGKEEFSGG